MVPLLVDGMEGVGRPSPSLLRYAKLKNTSRVFPTPSIHILCSLRRLRAAVPLHSGPSLMSMSAGPTAGASLRQNVEARSRRLVEQSKQAAGSFFAISEEAARLIDSAKARHAEETAARKREARSRAIALEKSTRPSNPLVYAPGSWRPGGTTSVEFGLPALQPKRLWKARSRTDDTDPSIDALKKALAGNFKRVVELFQQWDVNVRTCTRHFAPSGGPLVPTRDAPANERHHAWDSTLCCWVGARIN